MKKKFEFIAVGLFSVIFILLGLKLQRSHQSETDSIEKSAFKAHAVSGLQRHLSLSNSTAHIQGTLPLLEVPRSDAKKLVGRRDRPLWEELAGLLPKDLPQLKEAYRSTTNLLEKHAVTWALAFVGDEEAVQLFQKTLLADYAGKVLVGAEGGVGGDEAIMMEATIWALGLLANRHENAWEFLKQGTDPWFWKRNALWRSSYDYGTSGLLTTACIQGVGLSGRPEAEKLLETFKSQPLLDPTESPEIARSFAGDVLQAAFYLSIIKSDGMDGFRRWFFQPAIDYVDKNDRFTLWSSKPAVQEKWGEWYEKKNAEIELVRERLSLPGANAPLQ